VVVAETVEADNRADLPSEGAEQGAIYQPPTGPSRRTTSWGASGDCIDPTLSVPLDDRPSVRPLDLERAPTPTVFGMTSPVANPVNRTRKECPTQACRSPIRPADRPIEDTLRYYEKAGLIEAVDRSSNGQCRYSTRPELAGVREDPVLRVKVAARLIRA
jgi:hypothetical protein